MTSSLVVDFYVSVVHAAVRPAKYGGYRSNHSRWCTRVTVTAWALLVGCASGDEGQTGAPTGEFLPLRLSASSLLCEHKLHERICRKDWLPRLRFMRPNISYVASTTPRLCPYLAPPLSSFWNRAKFHFVPPFFPYLQRG